MNTISENANPWRPSTELAVVPEARTSRSIVPEKGAPRAIGSEGNIEDEGFQVFGEDAIGRFFRQTELIENILVPADPPSGPLHVIVIYVAVGAEYHVVLDIVFRLEEPGQDVVAVDFAFHTFILPHREPEKNTAMWIGRITRTCWEKQKRILGLLDWLLVWRPDRGIVAAQVIRLFLGCTNWADSGTIQGPLVRWAMLD